MDKVIESSAGGNTNTYGYYADGQLSDRMSIGSGSEAFYWDGLALLRRDDTNLTNEPAVTGSNPIMADGKVLFNDMLGSTLGSVEKGKYTASNLNLFGNKLDNGKADKYTYFTDKPHVQGLGYSFLFRNYREDLAKWQTSDPLGYPDGWNNFAYCNNWVTNSIDWLGGVRSTGVYTGEFYYSGLIETTYSGSYFNVSVTYSGDVAEGKQFVKFYYEYGDDQPPVWTSSTSQSVNCSGEFTVKYQEEEGEGNPYYEDVLTNPSVSISPGRTQSLPFEENGVWYVNYYLEVTYSLNESSYVSIIPVFTAKISE